jgi:DNA-binding CsgD family transcriptional regulator
VRGAALLDRDVELERARAVALGDSARLLAVEGPPGIGKTRLLKEAAAAVAAAGGVVVAARGHELETDLAWGGCQQLLLCALDGCDDALGESLLDGAGTPARALLTAATGARPGVDLPLLHAVAWVLAGAAQGAPLTIVVDDVQWLDGPSLRAIHFLALRLERLSAGMLLARRTGEPSANAELLDSLSTHPGAELVTLRPLGPEAVTTLVRTTIAGASDAVCAACAEASGGNPLYLTHLLAELRAEPGGIAPERVATFAPIPLARQVLARLGRLGADAVGLARAIALMADGAPLVLAAAFAGLGLDEATAAAGVLVRAGMLDDREPLRFAHPLVQRAIERDRPAPERAREHARLAELLHDGGAAPEAVATQLLAGAPGAGPWAADQLRAAADRALATAAPASAIAYLERALQEPLDEDAHAAVLVALSQAESAAGRPPSPALRDAIDGTATPQQRARMLDALGWSLHRSGRFDDSANAFAAARGLPLDDPELESALQFGHLATGLLSESHREATHAEATRLIALPSGALTRGQRAVVSSVLTQQLFVAAPVGPLLATTRRLDVRRVIAEETADSHTVWHLVGLLSWCDAHEVEAVLDDAFADATARASVLAFAMASYARSWPRLWAGRLDEAAADGLAAVDAWRGGMEMYLPAAGYWAACALLERGEDEQAAELVRTLGNPEPWGAAMGSFVFAAQGKLAAARGDHAAARDLHLACGAAITGGVGATNPSQMAWRSEAARAAAALGDLAHARALAAEELEVARRFGAPRALGVALTVDAVLAGDEARVREAIVLLDCGFSRLEHVRALVELGALIRRDGRRAAAREPLADALEHAHRLGARRLAERAHEELVATGARPRRAMRHGTDALTPSERRVAALAAQGVPNREIAGRLFVTVSTVEWHLRQAYAKLGIGSRRELPAELRGG